MSLPLIPDGPPDVQTETLVQHFRDAIELGRLQPGERLPPIRALAAERRVARAAVERAYRRLAELGLVTATVGRGTVVAGREGRRSPFSAVAEATLAHLRLPAGAPPGSDTPVVVDFAHLWPDTELFPIDEFGACLARVLARDGASVLRYGDPFGHPALRAQLARDPDLGDAGLTPEQILVTSGAQQGIDLVLRTCTDPGASVAVAVPSYHHLFGLLKAHGLGVLPLRGAPDAPDFAELAAALARPEVRLLYVMPTFHNPTGATLGRAEREELMRIVAQTQVPVLEDEFERELRCNGAALPSLRSLDPRGLTVTVRTFSKGLFPGVRIGWLAAAPELLARAAALKRHLDLESSPLLQAALAEFIAGGALSVHLRRLREELRARHDAAQRALAAHLPEGSRWTRPDGGYALWVELPPPLDGGTVARLAAARGVLVTPGACFDPRQQPCAAIRLSLSRTPPGAIDEGLAVLGAIAREQLGEPIPASRRSLFL
jgi:DNA-binding transcriptional MocR family regulator